MRNRLKALWNWFIALFILRSKESTQAQQPALELKDEQESKPQPSVKPPLKPDTPRKLKHKANVPGRPRQRLKSPQIHSEPKPKASPKIRGSVRRGVTRFRRPRVNPEVAQTLPALLENIQLTFIAMTRHAYGGSFTRPELRLGLKRMGPYVNVGSMHRVTEPKITITPDMHWSVMMFQAVNHGHRSDDEHMYPDFCYAQRIEKLPWNVEQLEGIPYECGFAYRAGKKKGIGKLAWFGFYVAANPETGEVKGCHEILKQLVHCPDGQNYTRKEWGVTPYAPSKDESVPGERERELGKEYRIHIMALAFCDLWDFWQTKVTMWTVAVHHQGERVTFCIPNNMAVEYFPDRERLPEVLTPKGKLRPILHIVREHVRQLGEGRETTVKDHIRGLRIFDWMGYGVTVTSPEYHAFGTHKFDLPPLDSENLKPGVKYIGPHKLGQRLAEYEDYHQVVRK